MFWGCLKKSQVLELGFGIRLMKTVLSPLESIENWTGKSSDLWKTLKAQINNRKI